MEMRTRMKVCGGGVLLTWVFGLAAALQIGASEPVNGVFGDADENLRLKKRVERIDSLIEAGLKEQGQLPNAMTSDAVFVRRSTLDVAGRIPTLEETTRFLKSQSATKRRDWIDSLLQSEGYVSREFNYWADLLRIQSRLRNAPSKPYIDWIKSALRENRPYDEMVRGLIEAEGYIWENGAAGYYLRDAGMPLDHMANTFQVFLGTQLVCAQCHDHPYDEFTQIDYYEQAAYIYGVKTTDRDVNKKYRQLNRRVKDDAISPETRQMARRLVRPLRYRVHETNSALRLPDDYQYDDAKPKSAVTPDTIFGDEIELSKGDSRRSKYAEWLASADNPRFATVIANRLWKRVMGVGLIEPVDDLADSYSASHPQLMDYLTQLMVDLDFDLQAYLRVLYNTETYQRAASQEEWEPGTDYYFAGPPLKRMTAEQFWDSIVGLVVEDMDERRGNPTQGQRYGEAARLVGMSADEILQVAKEQAEVDKTRQKLRKRQQTLQRQLKTAQRNKQKQRVTQLREEVDSVSKKLRSLSGNAYASRREGRRKRPDSADKRWKGLPSELVRASEVQSPAPPRHFLRQFGQSDRETIENANDDANVPQILTLLNGPVYEQLTRPNSLYRRNLESLRNPNQRLNAIYLTILTRPPSAEERRMLLPAFQNDLNGATEDLTWALLNTRQFAFIQ